MTEAISTNPPIDKLAAQTSPSAGLVQKITLFLVFLVCALAVFLLGSNYYRAFPTNGNPIYAAGVSICFLLGALLIRRSARFSRYWQILFAFFVASTVNLVSDLFAGYNNAIVQFLGVSISTDEGLALSKLYDALLVTAPILVLVKTSGADLGSLFLAKGNLKWALGIGVLVLVNFLTSALIFFSSGYKSMDALGSAVVWGILFSASNGLLEELWMRGLFLKKLIPFVGAAGAILLTSTWFSALHLMSVAFLPVTVVPVFMVNTFTLGLACGYIMWKTNSIWGAVIIHAAADLFLFISTLSI